MSDMSHDLGNAFSGLSTGDLSSLPVDLRWLSDLWRKLENDESKHKLNCLLNVWCTVLMFRQLHIDIENLPANSWSALSKRVHEGWYFVNVK